jgi:thiol-disulfide isomerase/thioredoxin
MKTRLHFALLAAALLCAHPAIAAENSLIDQPAPDFEGKLLSGDAFALGDHLNKHMVVLNFFTTDCAPCREEIPLLNSFWLQHKEEAAIVGVDVIENPDRVKAFVEQFGVGYPVIVDSGELTKALNVTGYPTTVVVGVNGNVQYDQMNVLTSPTDLIALLKINADLLKKKAGITHEDFAKRDGYKLIRMAPPEVKPVAGFDEKTAQKNEIFGIKVAKETPGEMDVDVDYYYAGDHGTTRVYIDCDPHTEDGGAPFGMLPAVAEVGRHTAHAPLTSYEGTPKDAVSTTIKCSLSSRLDNAEMATKTIEYKKAWGK